jgi:ribosomal protein S18 acetylase RimI-like enzyme
MLNRDYSVRKYERKDRDSIRRISCETAFLAYPRKLLFDDDEILADALTLYFTDYEPESCFVAAVDNKVIGYIIGSKDVATMNRVSDSKIIFPLLRKAFRRGVFCRRINWRFFLYVVRSAINREFVMPDFSKDFPATLHINIDDAYRGQRIGERLIETYLTFLKEEKAKGVHFGTFSEGANKFFLKMGFQVLFQSKRTYLKPYLGKEIDFYVFGRELSV